MKFLYNRRIEIALIRFTFLNNHYKHNFRIESLTGKYLKTSKTCAIESKRIP
jgi:hypothetical protein